MVEVNNFTQLAFVEKYPHSDLAKAREECVTKKDDAVLLFVLAALGTMVLAGVLGGYSLGHHMNPTKVAISFTPSMVWGGITIGAAILALHSRKTLRRFDTMDLGETTFNKMKDPEETKIEETKRLVKEQNDAATKMKNEMEKENQNTKWAKALEESNARKRN